MKKTPVSRRSFVKISTASLAALSLPELVSAQSDAPQQQQRPERQPADPIVAQPGNADAALYYKNTDKDRLHPNEAGHRRLAEVLLYQSLVLPCRTIIP